MSFVLSVYDPSWSEYDSLNVAEVSFQDAYWKELRLGGLKAHVFRPRGERPVTLEIEQRETAAGIA